MNRKHFIVQSGMAASSLLVSKSLLAYTGSPANKVRIGIMGVNSRGQFLAKSFAALTDVEVAYICEVDGKAAAKTVDMVATATGKKPVVFADVRKLLQQKDL